ncbi:MAG: mucoidy inhibitor MuiA family protein [Phycisphaerales bacterium]|nr:mucoidy inhibitor MuiA family protein [Phycisphaerales bacterium]
MNRIDRRAMGVACLVLAAGCAWGQQSRETAGRIDEVTVYRGRALVARAVDVGGGQGLREVVVTDLPDAILPESLFADAGAGVEVRSVRYRVRPVERDVRDEVRAIDDRIADAQKRERANQQRAALIQQQLAYLASLEQFAGATATAELRSGVLNADTIRSLSEFIFAERARLSIEHLEHTEEARALAEEVRLLQRERSLLAGRGATTAREAVVLVNLTAPESGEFRIRYLVANATWEPSYTVRTDENFGTVVVEYFAAIQQTSGEDWSDVAMTLSTATPSLVARAPTLSTMPVSLIPLAAPQAVAQQQLLGRGELADAREDLYSRRAHVERDRNTFTGYVAPGDKESAGGGRRQFDDELNRVANDLQLLDVLARGSIARQVAAATPRPEDQLSVTYSVRGRTSLPSRADRQGVQIAALTMPAEFYKLAAPVLTSQVYDEARLVNTSDMPLLPGPVSTYVAGRFVGHDELPLIASGESFTLGFGIDASLRASRELVEKTEQVQGGNRIVDLAYRLTLENYGASPANVRLVDRLPSSRGSEIKVTLLKGEDALSRDAAYQRDERKHGLLRWDANADARSIGDDAASFEYTFRLEYDRQMTIAGLGSEG